MSGIVAPKSSTNGLAESEIQTITVPSGAKTVKVTWIQSTREEYSSNTFSCIGNY
jgi:hypothetical protein